MKEDDAVPGNALRNGSPPGPAARRLALAAPGLFLFLATAAADWPAFRGPHGLGVGEARELPVRWSGTENVFWKKKLPGPGASSPITSGGWVFVTCYTGYGASDAPGDQKNLRRHLFCLDARTGAERWHREIPAKLPETRYSRFIAEHGYASSTPAADGERVYVFFGRTGVLAFDFEGRQLWQTSVGNDLNGWGSAASPVLYRDLVLINASVESSSVVALDRLSGKVVWKARDILDSWATPVVVALPGGGDEVVLSTPSVVRAFDPRTGAKRWECEGVGGSAATSTPVARDGVVYVMGAGVEGPLTLAVKAGGRGDVTATHVLWRQKAGTGISSPVLDGAYLYWFGGQAGCLRADTGQVVYREKLYAPGQEYASAVAADGRLFFFSRRKGAFVLAAGDRFERLAHNDLGDASDFNASPAVGDGCLLARSNECLYCLGAKK